MNLELRKIVTYVEEILIEGDEPVKEKCIIGAVMAVIKNPYAGCGFVEDLSPMIEAFAPKLGAILPNMVIRLIGEEAEAFGKGALIGTAGEIEHGSGIIHNRKFSDPLRNAVAGTSPVPSAEKRGVCGSSIDIALKHKADIRTRSHHMTFEVRIPDAPFPDEIVIICAASTKGRPHPRLKESDRLNK
jgi:hypothetical protein